MTSLLRIFRSSEKSFTGNVLKLITGTTLARALGILIAPILTRLFAPEAFGVTALFASIAGILGVVACLRYELAIMLPQTDVEAANVLGVSLSSAVMVACLATLICLLAGDRLVYLLKARELYQYLWLIPVSVFINGALLALTYWNSRTQHFGRLSLVRVISSVASQTMMLAAGFAGYVSPGVLIGGLVLGNIVSASLLGVQTWRDKKNLFMTSIRGRGILEGFGRYRKFPLMDIWGSLLNTISWQLPSLLLAPFFSMVTVGYYALGTNVIMVPMEIISGGIAQVFYQRASAIKNDKKKTAALVEGLFRRLVFLGLFPIFILCIMGRDFFSLIFGAQWSEAGLYAQILSPWLFFTFISSPLSSLYIVFERQGSAFFVHAAIFVTRFLSLYIGGIMGNVYVALGSFSLTGVLVYSGFALWNLRLANVPRYAFFRILGRYFIFFLIPALILIFAKYYFGLSPWAMLTLSVVAVSAHFLLVARQAVNDITKFLYFGQNALR